VTGVCPSGLRFNVGVYLALTNRVSFWLKYRRCIQVRVLTGTFSMADIVLSGSTGLGLLVLFGWVVWYLK